MAGFPSTNRQTKLAEVDTEFHKTYSSPDAKIQHILNSMYQIEKVFRINDLLHVIDPNCYTQAIFEGFGENDTRKKTLAKSKRQRAALDPNQQKSLVTQYTFIS